MGSLFTPKVPAPPPPPPDNTVYNFTDNISGTKGERVQNADGSYTMVYSKLPLTPEEQAYQDKLKSIETESLSWIEKISADPNYESDWVKQAVADYTSTTTKAVQQANMSRTKAEEQALARYGVEDSSAANAARAARGKDFAGNLEQITKDVNMFKKDARNEDLNTATSLYSLASGRGDVQLAQALQGVGQAQGAALNLSGLAQQRQLALYDAQNQYNAMRAGANAQGKATMGMLVGTGVGMLAGPAMGAYGAYSGRTAGYDPVRGINWSTPRFGRSF